MTRRNQTRTPDSVERLTLLDALTRYSETEVVKRLLTGRLKLAGNFRGRELEVAADYATA
jgi:hypothetical protein